MSIQVSTGTASNTALCTDFIAAKVMAGEESNTATKPDSFAARPRARIFPYTAVPCTRLGDFLACTFDKAFKKPILAFPQVVASFKLLHVRCDRAVTCLVIIATVIADLMSRESRACVLVSAAVVADLCPRKVMAGSNTIAAVLPDRITVKDSRCKPL
ncbi:expressed unknown protein [Seminavis robusta]|uniref:Uncharacterized protein n=1 Tax=Seminavis robusta TaxID=568900 RepID=A0A9N8DVN0_9STRA|nr:expressed unknown protein [Seminavis robusta]|eukprot:Sro327_g118380.1 n/a (158) ;mRNA; r:42315-42874